MSYANLLIGIGRLDQAARALEALAVKDGPVNFQLARLLRQLGQEGDAAKLFQAAGDDFSKKFSINNDNNFALLAAESYLAVDQWPAAVKVIDAAIEREPDNAQLRNMRAHVQADLAADYFKRGEYQKQWQQIESILSYAPNNPEALAQMVELAFAQGDKVPEASQRVDQLLVSGQAPAAVHLILGTRAAQVGDLDKAHLHLEQAKNQNPNAPVVLNNLAWVLAHAEPPRLEEASIVIEEALKMAPDVADILDTRAEIAISRGKPKDAITDLDKALKLRPSHKPYLERLVKAYQDAGDNDSAARIEKQIKAMK